MNFEFGKLKKKILFEKFKKVLKFSIREIPKTSNLGGVQKISI